MSTHQRIGAVSAPLENSQRFQRILTFLSVKNSAKIFKNLTKKWEKTTDFDDFRTEGLMKQQKMSSL